MEMDDQTLVVWNMDGLYFTIPFNNYYGMATKHSFNSYGLGCNMYVKYQNYHIIFNYVAIKNYQIV